MVKFNNEWDEILKGEFEKPYYLELREFLKSEYSSHMIYPSMNDIFNALKCTSYRDVSVVILGQDPYHGPNQAHGMAFSVKDGVQSPPSLQNIKKEISDDLGLKMSESGYLVPWAKQGVLLLNTVLTVRAGQANSHKGHGWETFTTEVIKKLNDRAEPIVFLLWGSPAKQKAELITNPAHKILATVHPSPLSAYSGFFGCRHFSKTNEFLAQVNRKPIDWLL